MDTVEESGSVCSPSMNFTLYLLSCWRYQVQETRSKKVLIKIYLYHLFELQACPPAVKTERFSSRQGALNPGTDILEMKGLLPQDFRSQSRSRRLLAIWKKSDMSAVVHLCDRFIDLVWCREPGPQEDKQLQNDIYTSMLDYYEDHP
ncbi:hypothetical protein DPEC_G00177220 [Dallia pectoralis]|uniref:Uncharacterized protein n=1 Tax=Dallia pectoralis TaxID=75939 RepID=A0ACC2GF74_DALPE|nr:hypothetical protein DPEC_G00177220 [Dallia pectoralis]